MGKRSEYEDESSTVSSVMNGIDEGDSSEATRDEDTTDYSEDMSIASSQQGKAYDLSRHEVYSLS